MGDYDVKFISPLEHGYGCGWSMEMDLIVC